MNFMLKNLIEKRIFSNSTPMEKYISTQKQVRFNNRNESIALQINILAHFPGNLY